MTRHHDTVADGQTDETRWQQWFSLHLMFFYSWLYPFLAVLEEGGVKMKLTVIDTPGFGDQINNENWWVAKSHQQYRPISTREEIKKNKNQHLWT